MKMGGARVTPYGTVAGHVDATWQCKDCSAHGTATTTKKAERALKAHHKHKHGK